ncbi:MAG: ABC transporter permease [Corynebacterium sp.]|nr:ABC transporter permease [Corynebacterium sp.]
MKYSSSQVIRVVTKREITSYFRSKATMASLIIVAILGVAAIFIISALQNRESDDTELGLVGISKQYFDDAAQLTNIDNVAFTEIPAAEAEQRLTDESLDAYLVAASTGFEYYSSDDPSSDMTVLLETGVNLWAQDAALTALDIPQDAYFDAYPPTDITTINTDSDEVDYQAVTALLIMIAISFFFIATFAGVMGSRVTEEKSSHVVSLLVAAARPVDILVGKILGNLIFGTLGTLVLTALFYTSYRISDLSADFSIPAAIIWQTMLVFVVAMLFFGSLYSAAGAMVARTEDIQSTQSPVLILLLASGYSAFFGATILESTLMTVLSWIPPFSVFLAPLQYTAGYFSAAEFWASYGIALLVTALIILLSARIYKIGILRSGSKIGWLSAFKR